MTSLSFPDINVWLALLLADHTHRRTALDWWDTGVPDSIAFCRITQLGVLRLLTTPAAMNGKPLTMNAAWKAHDRLHQDPRVFFLAEPASLEEPLRRLASGGAASPKLWADSYLTAFASRSGATLVTFDRALASRSENSLLLE
jgi:toxin-antitoxin system PIN domain toxin